MWFDKFCVDKRMQKGDRVHSELQGWSRLSYLVGTCDQHVSKRLRAEFKASLTLTQTRAASLLRIRSASSPACQSGTLWYKDYNDTSHAGSRKTERTIPDGGVACVRRVRALQASRKSSLDIRHHKRQAEQR